MFQSFIQIFIISALNVSTALGFIGMQIVRVPQPVVIFTSFAHLMTEGAPVVIYVFMNKTINDGMRALFGRPATPLHPTTSVTQTKAEERRPSNVMRA